MFDNEKKRIAAIFAHPDDETLGCGATLARLAKQGHEIHILICGEGITARFDSRDQAPAQMLESLNSDLHMAAAALGATSVQQLDFLDNRFDERSLLDLVKAVEAFLKDRDPQVIFTHDSGDLNIDHRRVYEAVMTAARPLPGSSVEAIFACEVLSSTDWAGTAFTPFSPTWFVNIAETLPVKLQAMACYQSESAPFPHPRSAEAIEAQARFRGVQSGFAAAEAFCLIRNRSF